MATTIRDDVGLLFGLLKVYDIPGLAKIRLGRPNDGGYVVAKELCERSKRLFSIGVGDDVSFEEDFHKLNPGATIKCFDPTIEGIETAAPIQFYKNGIEPVDQSFSLGETIDPELGTVGPHTIKVDIEGDEIYMPLDDLPQCDQLIIEMHLFTVQYNGKHSPYFTRLNRALYDRVNRDLLFEHTMLLWRILQWFYLFHIHGNNSLPKVEFGGHLFPPLLEMTFVNKRVASGNVESADRFPGPIDMPNKTDRPDFESLFPFRVEEAC